MSESSGDKKHPASERRREQAKSEGQIPRSADLTSAALLLVAIGLLRVFGTRLTEMLGGFLTDSIQLTTARPFDVADATHIVLRTGALLAVAILPISSIFFLGTIAINLAQTGIVILPEKAMPNWSHVNPLNGFARLFSLPNVMRLAFGVFKLVVVCSVAYHTVKKITSGVLSSAQLSSSQIAHFVVDSVLGTCLWIGGSLFILALLDYAFQRWKFEQDLMMTDQELRNEMKDSEGDPQIAAKRRQFHRQLATQKMRQEVPKSDVVVTNPTELAIAIRYDPKTMPAPIVVAKGAGIVAQTIRRIALEAGVPVVERKPLAQVLYKAVDVGQMIPLDQFNAVAEVLRYVYQLQGRPIPKA